MIRRALRTTAFGINEHRMARGLEGVEHNELDTSHDDLHVVLEGGGTFTADRATVEVVAFDYRRVDAEATRKVVAGADGLRYDVVAAKLQLEYDGLPFL